MSVMSSRVKRLSLTPVTKVNADAVSRGVGGSLGTMLAGNLSVVNTFVAPNPRKSSQRAGRQTGNSRPLWYAMTRRHDVWRDQCEW